MAGKVESLYLKTLWAMTTMVLHSRGGPSAPASTEPAQAPQSPLKSPARLGPPSRPRPERRPSAVSKVAFPTTAETAAALRRRLGKELRRIEMDLAEGGRIAGKPCNCLSQKHNLGLEATAEELIPIDPAREPLYSQIIRWVHEREAEFEPEEIGKRPPEYYKSLTPMVRKFRGEVMGTEDVSALLSNQEKEMVRQKVKERLNSTLGGGNHA